MTVVDPRFGATLRHLRQTRGLTLRGLAARAHYSRSHLHALETGRARPTVDTARQLDEALQAGGSLAALVHEIPTPDDARERLDHATRRPRRTDRATVDALADLLAAHRRLDDIAGAAAVLPAVRAHLGLITGLLADAAAPVQAALLAQAAQWSQFAGWLGIADADPAYSRTSLDRALQWTTGPGALAGVILSFRGYLAEELGDPAGMLDSTRVALAQPGISPGQTAYDHYQLARALALTGEGRAAADTLTAADDLADAAVAHVGPIPPWDYYRDRAFYQLESGASRALLGQHERAVDLLTAGLAGLPADADSADWTGGYLCRLAVSLLAVGERDRAADAARRAHRIAARNRTGRLVAELGRLPLSTIE